MQKTLKWLSIGAVIWFAVLSAFIGMSTADDSHDGYLFLSQARRLIDSNYRFEDVDATRTRLLLLPLMAADLAAIIIKGRPGTLIEHHILMWLLSLCCIGMVFLFARRWFGNEVAYVTVLLFVVNPVFLNYSWQVLADVAATAVLMLFFVLLKKLGESGSDTKQNFLLLGAVGGMLAQLKYQFFFFFPMVATIFIGFALFSRTKLTLWLRLWGWGLVSYFLVVDLSQRMLGSPAEGFWYGVRLHFPYFKLVMTTEAVASPPLLYLLEHWENYGPLLGGILLLALSGAFTWWKNERDSQEPLNKVKWGCLLGSFVLLLAMFQVIRHRESRYLLPLLPIGFAIAIAAARETVRLVPAKYGLVLSGLFLLLLSWPVAQATAIFSRQMRYAKSPFANEQFRFVNYLSAENDTGPRCSRIWACRSPVIDMAFYRFFIPKAPTTVAWCPVPVVDFAKTSLVLMQETPGPRDSRGCFVVTSAPPQGDYPSNLAVYRPLKVDLKAPLSDPNAKCVEGRNDRFDCYEVENFFAENTLPALVAQR